MTLRAPLFLCILLTAIPTFAQNQTAVTSDSTFDVTTGPTLGSARVVGMGGSFTSIAEGSEGLFRNPAALANRPRYGEFGFTLHFSLDLSLDSGNFNIDETDLDGDNRTGKLDRLGLGNTSIGMMIAKFAFGVLGEGYEVKYKGARKMSAATWVLAWAYAFSDGGLIIGMGPAINTLDYIEKYRAFSWEFGVLHRPKSLPVRFGMKIRTKAVGDADTTADVPGEAVFPWRISFGASFKYLFNGRPYNFMFSEDNEEDEVADAEKRYVLLSADVQWVGSAPDNTVSTESFLTGDPREAGKGEGLGYNIGVESELWTDTLRLRAGHYAEVDRFAKNTPGKPHYTFGVDVAVLELILTFKVGAAIDIAENYQNIMFGIGTWD